MPKMEYGKRMKNKNITGIGKKNFIIKNKQERHGVIPAITVSVTV